PEPLTAPTISSTFNGGYNISCSGNTDGSIDVTATGGMAPFTYLWSNGATTEDLSGLGAGTYSVSLTDANGCTATTGLTITLTEPLVLTAAVTSFTDTLGCNGSGTGAIDISV